MHVFHWQFVISNILLFIGNYQRTWFLLACGLTHKSQLCRCFLQPIVRVLQNLETTGDDEVKVVLASLYLYSLAIIIMSSIIPISYAMYVGVEVEVPGLDPSSWQHMSYVVAVTYQQIHLSRTLCSTVEGMDVATVSNLEGVYKQRMVGQFEYSPI